MFTGIIEELATIEKIDENTLSIKTNLAGIRIGESIAVNGVCLTVSKLDGGMVGWSISFELSEETLKKTNLGELKKGDKVNLERALKIGDRLGGHFVTGHIGGVGKILPIKPEKATKVFEFSAPPEIAKYLVPKGSIAIDGISLTVVEIKPASGIGYPVSFTVSVIPYTLKNTTLGFKKPGDTVNLEPDILAKYTERALEEKKNKKEITLDFLRKTGFLSI